MAEKEYIERKALLQDIAETVVFSTKTGERNLEIKGAKKVIGRIQAQPTADVQEVVRCKDEKCVICNSEIDEKYAGGLWDLAGEICNELLYFYSDEQDIVYNILRNFIERQNYCPYCGAKMDKE